METFFGQTATYLWTQSAQIAVLCVLVGAACFALRKRTSHLRYLLWLLIVAKCLVPSLLTVSLAILPNEPEPVAVGPVMPILIDMPPAALETTYVAPATPTFVEPTPAEPSIFERLSEIGPKTCFGMIWLAGLCVFTVVVLAKAARIHHHLKSRRRPVGEALQNEADEILTAAGKTPRLWLVAGTGQPFVWGLVRGSVYLPANFTRSTDRAHRRKILAHELAHVARFDALVNVLQTIAQAIFWFHPLVWIANRCIRAEREKCCDETAIARLAASPKDYSNAIVDTLVTEYKSTLPTPSLAIAGPIKNIEDRIKTIMKPGKKFYKRPTVIAIATICFLAAVVVPTTIALTERKAESGQSIETDDLKSEKKKPDVPVEAKTKIAWGNEVNGLQLGLGFYLQGRPYRQGEVVSVKIYARNTGEKTANLAYSRLTGLSPVIYDSEGKTIYVKAPLPDRIPGKMRRSVKQGETKQVGSVRLKIDATANTKIDSNDIDYHGHLKPGEYRLGLKLLSDDYPEDNWHSKLKAGELKLTIVAADSIPLKELFKNTSFEAALKNAQSYPIQFNSEESILEGIKRYKDVIIAFPDRPELYKAKLGLFNVLRCEGSEDNLSAAAAIIEDLVERVDLDTSVGRQLALQYIDFHLSVAQNRPYQNLAQTRKMIDSLLLKSQNEKYSILRLKAERLLAEYHVVKGDEVKALRIVIDALNRAKVAWVKEGFWKDTWKKDRKLYSQYMRELSNLSSRGGWAVERADDPIVLEMLKERPLFLGNPELDFLGNAEFNKYRLENTAVPVEREKRAKRVKELFSLFVKKDCNLSYLPEFIWADIPVLLELAQNENKLKRMPVSLASSYAPTEGREGMVALWLIETLRQMQVAAMRKQQGLNGHMPLRGRPMNAFCVKGNRPAKECESSLEIHREVLKLYQRWWRTVGRKTPAETAIFCPLELTDIRWKGWQRWEHWSDIEIFKKVSDAGIAGQRIIRELKYHKEPKEDRPAKKARTIYYALKQPALQKAPFTKEMLEVQKIVLHFYDDMGRNIRNRVVFPSAKASKNLLPDSPDVQVEGEKRAKRVKELFSLFVKKDFTDFPEVIWSDIPTLLELAQNENKIERMSGLFASSYAPTEGREGMVALWLIETLRLRQVAAMRKQQGVNGHLPFEGMPMNAFCIKGNRPAKECESSRQIHREVLKLYQRWWRAVGRKTSGETAIFCPLDLTDIRWQGWPRWEHWPDIEIFKKVSDAGIAGQRIIREVEHHKERKAYYPGKKARTIYYALKQPALQKAPFKKEMLEVQKTVLHFYDDKGRNIRNRVVFPYAKPSEDLLPDSPDATVEVQVEGKEKILKRFFNQIDKEIGELKAQYPQLADWNTEKTDAKGFSRGKEISENRLIYNHAAFPGRSPGHKDWCGENGCHIQIVRYTGAESPYMKARTFPLKKGTMFAVIGRVITENPEVPELEQKINDILQSAAASAASEPAVQAKTEGAWGSALDGVQCRVRAGNPTWPQGTVPKLFADLRNQGERNLQIALEHESWEIEIDGKWHETHTFRSGRRRYLPLEAGGQQQDLKVWIHSNDSISRKLRALEPGKHTLRVARLINYDTRPRKDMLRVVSNPVEIEIVAARDVEADIAAMSAEGNSESLVGITFVAAVDMKNIDSYRSLGIQGGFGNGQPICDFKATPKYVSRYGNNMSKGDRFVIGSAKVSKSTDGYGNTGTKLLLWSAAPKEGLAFYCYGYDRADKSYWAIDRQEIQQAINGYFIIEGKDRTTELSEATAVSSSDEQQRELQQAWLKLHDHVSEGWQLYMDDNDGMTAGTLSDLKPQIDKEIWPWTKSNVVLVSKRQRFSEIETPSEYPIAYDKSLLQEGHGTNVAFADGHVEYIAIADIERVIPRHLLVEAVEWNRKAKKAVEIEARFLIFPDKGFLEEVGMGHETVSDNILLLSKKESELKTEAIASSGPVDKPTNVKVPVEVGYVDDLQVKRLIKATQMHRDSSMLTAPRITVLENEEAELKIVKEIPFIAGYKEGHTVTTADEPVEIHDRLKAGTILSFTPSITEDEKHCVLELEAILSELSGYDRRWYLGKFSYDIPQMEVLELKCTGLYVPAGKTLLLFAPRDSADDKKGLIMLIKPVIAEAKKNIPTVLPSIGGPGFGGFGGFGGGNGGGSSGGGGYGGGFRQDNPADSGSGGL